MPAELRRVARGPVVVFTFELDALPAWQLEFLREGIEAERPRFPPVERVAELAREARPRDRAIAAPGDCTDGFFEAFWRRPEALLDAEVRSAQSMWALLGDSTERAVVDRLAAALESGRWDADTATCESRRASRVRCG